MGSPAIVRSRNLLYERYTDLLKAVTRSDPALDVIAQGSLGLLQKLAAKTEEHPALCRWLKQVQLPYYSIAGDVPGRLPEGTEEDAFGWNQAATLIDDAIEKNAPLEVSAGGLAFILTVADFITSEDAT